MPPPAVGYSENGVLHFLSHPIVASLSWWPWATPPPAPCTMGFSVPFCPLCTHQYVPLPIAQTSQFWANLRTVVVPSPVSFASQFYGPFRCLPLTALAGGGAMSTLCPNPRTPLVVLLACGLPVHPPNLACPPTHRLATPLLSCLKLAPSTHSTLCHSCPIETPMCSVPCRT